MVVEVVEEEESVPVLIVGGGPVGLATALFLGRLGVPCALVERRATTSPLTRSTGVHARSMELFRMAGVDKDIRKEGMVLVPPEVAAKQPPGGDLIPRVILRAPSLDRLEEAQVVEMGERYSLDLSPALPVWCGQDLLEPVLRRGAERLGSDIRFHHELTGVEQRDGHVHATVTDHSANRSYRVRARYLVAADGPRSPLRERLGIERSGHGLLQRMVSVVFRADLRHVVGDRRFILTFVHGRDFQGVVVCLNGRDRWMVWTGYPAESAIRPADFGTDDHLRMVKAAIGREDHDVTIEGAFPWTSEHLVADRFRDGGVFLAGDAAHTHPPHGSFGANTGIQDAHNLSWKLAAVLRGWAGDGLLDSYEAERRPVAFATADQALLRERNRSTAHRDPGFRDFPTVILGYGYASTAVDRDKHDADGPLPTRMTRTATPGFRVPHVRLRRGGAELSTLDLCDEAYVLLVGDTERDAWHRAALDLAEKGPVPLRSYRVGPDGEVDLTAEERAAGSAARLVAPGPLLLRPDGFVAWRGTDADATGPDRVRDHAAHLRRLLGRLLDAATA
ncbi:FAD-dependent monooxygenase [Streptomyces sp. NRRL B-1347]|uniref:FAD-dependent monooxygenase n=1 Tax=Streptomyces sp. NRRL B-1347 TaxID=1476877 RepID=UPI00068EEDF3|nr:FAD-dependent monooxygenase [Streptomyces sp. NRRL B-1347]